MAENIRRRGKSWVIHFRVDGKQHWRSFKTKSAAELYLTQVKVKKARGERVQPTRIRFADFVAEWLRDYAWANVRGITFDGYEATLRNHLIPEFGRRYLTEIARKDIDAFVADWVSGGPRYQERVRQAQEREAEQARTEKRKPRTIQLGHSPKTVANGLVPLREMLGHALEWDYLMANPAIGVRRPRVEREEMEFLDAKEIGKLLSAASSPFCRTFLTCAVTTGMRLGELRALKWGDVDWNSRRLWVRRGVDRRGRFSEPKTRTSVRAVAMPATLVSELRSHQLALPRSGEEDLIFPSERGTPLDDGNIVRREFKPALRRAKLRQVRFHDLRHSFASLMIAQGAHPKLISEQLGHASVQITLDRYGHLMDQSYGDASEQLEAALFGSSPASGLQAAEGQTVPHGAAEASAAPTVLRSTKR